MLHWQTSASIEIIDELLPLYNVKVSVKVPVRVKDVYCVPQGEKLEFSKTGDCIEFALAKLECRQMIELKLA